MKLEAIVFDLDDTLYPEKDFVFSGLKAVDAFLAKRNLVSGFYDTAAALFRAGERKQLFNKALERLDVRYDDSLILQLVELYRGHLPQISLFSDARWILARLNSEVKLGLISDGYLLAQEQKVKALGLDSRFDAIVLSDTFGRAHWKPSPIPYEALRAQLDVEHYQCVYIGDNANKDFITARKLGWMTVHVDRQDGIHCGIPNVSGTEAHYKIDSLVKLAELPELWYLFVGERVSNAR